MCGGEGPRPFEELGPGVHGRRRRVPQAAQKRTLSRKITERLWLEGLQIAATTAEQC